MFDYRPEAWHDLAVGTVTATAALIGLLFVSVSINLTQIIKYPSLPRRALGTLGLLLALLIAGIFVLIPGQRLAALAIELGVTGLLLIALGVSALIPPAAETDGSGAVRRILPALLLLLPAIALTTSGVSVGFKAGGGLYWLAAAMIAGIVAACVNAWVLLVEIQR